jgi:hypothetical protein
MLIVDGRTVLGIEWLEAVDGQVEFIRILGRGNELPLLRGPEDAADLEKD